MNQHLVRTLWIGIGLVSGCGGEAQGGHPAGGRAASGGAGGAAAGGGGSSSRECTLDEATGTVFPGVCAHADSCDCPGDTPRPECRASLRCEKNGYRYLVVPNCELESEGECPATVAAAKGQPCFTRGARCSYPGRVACYCASIDDLGGVGSSCIGTVGWFCGDSPFCPEGVPEFGDACEFEGESCGEPCFNIYALTCTGGVWGPRSSKHECL